MRNHITSMALLAVMLTVAACGGSDTHRRPHATQRTPDSVAGATAQEQAIFDAFTKREPEFRKHYDDHFAQSGYAYNQFRPAYQHGFELGFDPHYRDMDWRSIEQEARHRWNESRMGLWDRYQEAVRYGWERGVVAARG